MKTSIVIICWNDAAVIAQCIQSIYAQAQSSDFEIIVADNGSTDDSVPTIRKHFPAVKIVENGRNLGFGAGNNAGIHAASGEYILILNPDTIIRNHAVDEMVRFADQHPEAGAFGCRVLNTDGTLQETTHRLPNIKDYFLTALGLRRFVRLAWNRSPDTDWQWKDQIAFSVGFAAGCCLLVRGPLLHKLGGFDPLFDFQFEDADLCHRVTEAGQKVLFWPAAEITHIGGMNRGRYPVRVVLETYRSRYRYFYKHYGAKAALRIRQISLMGLCLRFAGYRLIQWLHPTESVQHRVDLYRVLLPWNWRLDPIAFVTRGAEPDVGYKPILTQNGPIESTCHKGI